ncbi:hypothetical protein DV515_00009682, partial [Chloebia gouldiae]
PQILHPCGSDVLKHFWAELVFQVLGERSCLRFVPGCGFSLVNLSEQAAANTLWTSCVYNTQSASGAVAHQVSIMTDWVLLGLIAALVVLLLLTIFGFVVYSGLFTEVVVSAGSPPVGNMTLAYKFRVGPYGESGQLFTDGCSISSKLCSIGVYYDNPHTVSPEKCRFAIGRILSEGDAKPSEEQIKQFQKYGFKIFSFPAPSHVVMATFPFTTPLSIHLAVNRVHPALDTYIKRDKS